MTAYGTAQEVRVGDRVTSNDPGISSGKIGTVLNVYGRWVRVEWDAGGWSIAPATNFFPVVRAPEPPAGGR